MLAANLPLRCREKGTEIRSRTLPLTSIVALESLSKLIRRRGRRRSLIYFFVSCFSCAPVGKGSAIEFANPLGREMDEKDEKAALLVQRVHDRAYRFSILSVAICEFLTRKTICIIICIPGLLETLICSCGRRTFSGNGQKGVIRP